MVTEKQLLGNSMEPSRVEIWKMFDGISQTYDRVNRFMTCGLDKHWRRKLAYLLPQKENLYLLDCATGTGDQIFSILDNHPSIEKVIGIDLAEEMLAVGKSKAAKHPLGHKIEFLHASALSIPFPDSFFDCISFSFGIRNITDVDCCLQELLRVLKPGGKLLILETSLPKNRIFRFLHGTYMEVILPYIGGWISQKKEAYQYLNQTAKTFPYGEKFCALLDKATFKKAKTYPLTLGAVSIYEAEKQSL